MEILEFFDDSEDYPENPIKLRKREYKTIEGQFYLQIRTEQAF